MHLCQKQPYTFHNLLNHFLIFLTLFSHLCQCFQFTALRVSASPLTIREVATYQFTLVRQLSSDATTTPWNTQAVPAGSTISIVFPAQFTITGTQSCLFILVNSAPIATPTCNVVTATRTVQFNDAVTADTFISDVTVSIGGVTNPSPALVSSSFIGHIGNDVSVASVNAAVTLQPASLQSLSIQFDPSTVNTTSSMKVTLVTSNAIPAAGSIVVGFPALLRWAKQASSGHLLPITNVMGCSAIQNIRFTISCSGDSASATVTLINLFDTQVPAATTLSFTINQIFSPPTTEPIDQITITTYHSSPPSTPNYQIDTLHSTISNLAPKPITMSLTTTTQPIINTFTGITFSFSLPDTLTRNDYFQIVLPSGSTFNYITHFCLQLNLTNVTYTAATSTIRFQQSNSSPNTPKNTNVVITLLSYRTSSSVVTLPITMSILNNDYMKMEGRTSITTLPKQYVAVVATGDTGVNVQTYYTVAFQLSDSLASSGYFVIQIPRQLTLNPAYTVTISGPNIAPTPTTTKTILPNTTTTLTLTNLNLSSSTIPTQNLTIRINNLIQPNSVQNISAFITKVYYSDANDLVAQATSNNVIQTTPGVITGVVVDMGSRVNSNMGTVYTVSLLLRNKVGTNGKIQITMPVGVGVVAGGVCKIDGSQLLVGSCLVVGQVITMVTPVQLTTAAPIVISYSSITNPVSTKPTAITSIKTMNSANQLIDILSSLASQHPSIQTTLPSAITTGSLLRGNQQNGKQSLYSFTFTQTQPIIEPQAILILKLPPQITIIPNQLQCLYLGSPTTQCQYQPASLPLIPQSIRIVIPSSPSPSHQYTITIPTGMYNPVSLSPTSSIAIWTYGMLSSEYLYSSKQAGLTVTNTFASLFNKIGYQFGNRYLSSVTDLVVTIDYVGQLLELERTGYFVVVPAASFGVQQTSPISCQSVVAGAFVPICTLSRNPITNLAQIRIQTATTFPQTIQLSLQTFTTPTNIPNDYTKITSYTSNNYIISQSQNLIKFTTLCTFPCRECNVATPTICLSCYDQGLTNKVYLFSGRCLASCPQQFYEDVGDLICRACLDPCYQCSTVATNCTYCDLDSTFIYLNVSAGSSTCLSQCPSQMYPDTTQIPNLCTPCLSPCLTCLDANRCLSCIPSHFLYQQNCLSSCPAQITIQTTDPILSINICQQCSDICETCSIQYDNCVSCTNNTALLNGTCVSECPGTNVMVIQDGECVLCDGNCMTCIGVASNCLSCRFETSVYKYLFLGRCLLGCPDFFYSNSFGVCQDCQLLNRGCKNCSSPSICLSCDSPYIFLNNNCLNTVPDGYLNISGIAIPCQGQCQTCSITLTNCTSCRTLNLFGNTCTGTCPQTYIPLNQICQSCLYPCDTCQQTVSKCLTCRNLLNSTDPLFLSNFNCIEAALCPATTYPNVTLQICKPCSAPCLECSSDVLCRSCRIGYFFLAASETCEISCPFGTIGLNRVCQLCQSPCQSCATTRTRCLSCIDTFFFFSVNSSCLTDCPLQISIANDTTMQCQSCLPPCKTCVNITTQCLTCTDSSYMFQQQCVLQCPDGYYGTTTNNICQTCDNNCTTCSSATICLSCPLDLYLYKQQCIQQCPDSHAFLPQGNNICTACSTYVIGCSNCTDLGFCYQCYSPYKYLDGACLNQCPDTHNYDVQIFECVVKNQTDIVLEENLNSDNVFPVPFTVLAGVCIIASCMSKLQNRYTYIIGLIYCLLGLVETGCLGYLIFRYWQLGVDHVLYDWNSLLLLLVTAGVIYLLNILSFLIQTPLLTIDQKFKQWLTYGSNKCAFAIFLIISVLINYKFKMMPFTKLFRFYCLSATLSSVSKFRVFNIFSFFGIIAQALGLYVCFVVLLDKTKLQQTATTQTINFNDNLIMQYAFLDVIIVFMLNIIFAILIAWKNDKFFEEEEDGGYTMNKVINIGGDDYSKDALEGQINQEKFLGDNYYEDSYGVLGNQVIDELSESLTESKYSDGYQKSKVRVYFVDQAKNGTISQENGQEESSNPIRRQFKQSDNIFSQMSDNDQRFSDNRPEQNAIDGNSEAGGSQKVIVVKSPTKIQVSPRKKQIAIVGRQKRSNMATEQDSRNQGDVNKRISERERQLDQIRKQMQQKQKQRKQKRKSQKKLKKRVVIDDSPQKQISYEQLSINQTCSVKNQQTQQGSLIHNKPQNILQKSNINMKQADGPQLSEQQVQKTINSDLYPPENDDQNDRIDNWIQIKIQEQNRSKLPVFIQSQYQDKQLRTLSRNSRIEEQHKNNDQNKQREQRGQRQEKYAKQLLQQEKQQSTIGRDIDIMHKETIKGKQYYANNKRQSIQEEQNQSVNENGNRGKDVKNVKKHMNKQLLEDSNVKQVSDVQLQYAQSLGRDLSMTERTEKQRKSRLDAAKYEYESDHTEYDQRGNSKLNYYKQIDENRQSPLKKNVSYEFQEKSGEDESGLEDSINNDHNEKINERPFSAVRKPNQRKNNEALLQILDKAERDRLKLQKSINSRKIPKQQSSPSHQMFRIPQQEDEEQDQHRYEHREQQDDQSNKPNKKSKVYLAGLRQVQKDSLKKKTLNNSRGISNDDSQLDAEQMQSNKYLHQSRNKSFNTAPFKKYPSKDMSIDQMSFTHVQQPPYMEMMNPRHQGRQVITRNKPGSSGSMRTKVLPGLRSNREYTNPNNQQTQDAKKQSLIPNNNQSFNDYQPNRYVANEDDSLKEYYSKERQRNQIKSREKSRSKISRGHKSGKKDRQLSRERSLEDTKRFKQLQKIYAPPK